MNEHEELPREAAPAAETAPAAEPQQPDASGETTPGLDAATMLRNRMLFVMAIVAVLCGGNGIGIVAAGIFWKQTQNLAGAIGILVAVTAGALVIVALIALLHHRKVKRELEKFNEEERKSQ